MSEIHEFTLILNREPTDDELDALFEAGCDDALIGAVDAVGVAEFSREAPSFVDAVLTAIETIHTHSAVRVLRVEPDDLVTAADIAERTGRTRESVRLLINGERGSGGFPVPFTHSRSRIKLWRWSDVAAWLGDAHAASVGAAIGVINARLESAALLARVDYDDAMVIDKLLPAPHAA